MRLETRRLLEEVQDESSESIELPPKLESCTHLRNPMQIMDIATKSIGEHGAGLRSLVSPNTAATSTLVCSALSLPPGSQMAPRQAVGVELYYVVQGTGILAKENNEEVSIARGEAILVDPWR